MLRIGVGILFIFWLSIFLIDASLKRSSFSNRYKAFLERSGLSLSFGRVRWFSTLLNRQFLRFGSWKPNLQQMWFFAGAVFGILAMFGSVIFLSYSLWFSVFSVHSVGDKILIPVLPGINLPYSHLLYFFCTLLVCGILHEAGHMMAAVCENVSVNGYGLFIIGIYPGAYVDLSTDQLFSISPWKQLTIYCAGVWHNFITTCIASAILFVVPYMLVPFFASGTGVHVQFVDPSSPVFGASGIAVDSVIQSINGCPVRSSLDFSSCMQRLISRPSVGYCLDSFWMERLAQPMVSAKSSRIHECCANSSSHSDLCFSYTSTLNIIRSYRCLPARVVTRNNACYNAFQCNSIYGSSPLCVFAMQDNNSRFLRVSHSKSDHDLLYIGDPYLFTYSLTISDYTPLYQWASPLIPEIITRFLKYIISFSAALALLNSVPSIALDGQWILTAFLGLPIWGFDRADKQTVRFILLTFGTLLLGANIIVAFINLIRF